jgi:hypothetical protein
MESAEGDFFQVHIDEKMTRQSKLRHITALSEGRVPHRNGHPPYLELHELEILQQQILISTTRNQTLRLRDIQEMV